MAPEQMAEGPAGGVPLPPPRPLDAIDQDILQMLQADGRASIRSVAERVHVSRANAYARINRLVEDGVIRGFGARVNHERAGQDTSQQTLGEAVGLFQALGKDVSVIGDVPGMIVARTVARIVDLAHDAVAKGVATQEDIDTAMRLGVNYPLGPFEWSRRLGRNWAYALLDDLHLRDPSGRYAPSLALYRHAYASDKREGSTS